MPIPYASRGTEFRPIRLAAALGLFAALAAAPAFPAGLTPDACAAPRELLTSAAALPHMAQKLALGAPVKIVAFGSSSTAGIGASSPAATYPSRFAQELHRLFPQSHVTIVNKGVPGEDVREELTRFQRDVLDQRPDLLIWQTGTNSALNRRKAPAYADRLSHGIEQAQAAGVDVLLMSPQFSPKFEAVPNHNEYLEHLTTVATERRVPLLRRYEIMKFWLSSGEMTQAQMVNRDGLHQTDASYYCLGVITAHMVAGLANRPAFLADVTARAAK